MALGIPFVAERLGDCTSTMIEHANTVEKVANLQHRIPRSIVRTILDRDYYILLCIGSRSAPQIPEMGIDGSHCKAPEAPAWHKENKSGPICDTV